MTGRRRVGAHDVQPVCGHSTCTHCGHVVRGENFFLKKMYCARCKPFPTSPPKGFETYINSFFTTCMVRPGWGATGNSGRELTRGCYALKHKYHLPCTPAPLLQFFCQHTYRKNVYRDEGIILSHICWGPGGPLPFSRPQTPPPPPPP